MTADYNVHTDKLHLKHNDIGYDDPTDAPFSKLTCCGVPVSIRNEPHRTDNVIIEYEECGAADFLACSSNG